MADAPTEEELLKEDKQGRANPIITLGLMAIGGIILGVLFMAYRSTRGTTVREAVEGTARQGSV